MSPQTSQGSPIPILIGGNGQKRTLRTCARYADTSNLDFWHPTGIEFYKQSQAAIDQHCEDFGRDPAEVRRTVCIPTRIFDTEADYKKSPGQPWYNWGTVSMVQDNVSDYIEAGVDEVMFCGLGGKSDAWHQLEEVLAVFR